MSQASREAYAKVQEQLKAPSVRYNNFDVTQDWKYAPLDGYNYVIYNPANPQQAVSFTSQEFQGSDFLPKYVSKQGSLTDFGVSPDKIKEFALSPQDYAVQQAALHGARGDELNKINTVADPYSTTNTLSKTNTSTLPVVPNKVAGASSTVPQQQQLSSQGLNTASPIAQQNPGFALTGNNLKYGSTGDDVKKLQQYFIALGADIKADGIFGPKTQAAVTDFQKAHGLTPDGIVGPKTVSAINSVQQGSKPAANTQASTDKVNSSGSTNQGTYNTGDSALDDTLSELNKYVQDQLSQGLKINPDLNFDQATLDKFLETAKTQVHPYYQNQIDNIKSNVLRLAPQILQNYDSDIASKEANFQNNLGTARENYAGSGLAFSGQRAKGELGMKDTQNRDLASLNQNYGNQLYDLGRTAESKIGSSNSDYNLGSLKNYSANLGGNGGFSLDNSSSPYTAGNYGTGSLQYEEEQAKEARRQALLTTASENVRNGRSYNDLFA